MPDEVDVWFSIDPEQDKVRDWREQQLVAAGIDEDSAFRLALRFDIDLHQLVEAAEGGATGLQLTDLYLD